jgi:predicted ATP-dependent serine protease
LVIDAFSNIEAGNLKGQKASDYCLQKIMEGCHKTNTTVFNVLHMTKGGKTKGSSNIGHAADIDCHIYRGNPDVWASSSVRIISTFGHKNRFAPETQLAFNMTGAGWDLDDVIANEFEIMAEKKPYLK